MNLLSILLQAAAAQPETWKWYVFLGLMFVVFYFFMIRPQSKRQKEVRKFQDSLENGKHVVTQGGIFGKVREVKDNYVLVEIADNVRIKVSKSMVYDAVDPQQAAQK